MSDEPPSTSIKARRSGCQRLVLIVGGLIALAVVAIISFAVYYSFHIESEKFHRRNRPLMKDLRIALMSYKSDYKRLPLPATSAPDLDLSLRSRGPMLPALLGEEAGGLNPKKIKFIDLPTAKNSKFGLLKDGEEWVLNDTWGEPYFLVLDTNSDGKVANPEYGADQSDPGYAKLYKNRAVPPELPVETLIYSSGPDRDPRTWKDNVCSWQVR